MLGGPAFLVREALGRDTVGLGVLVPHRAREHGLVPVRLLALNATGDPARDVVTIEDNGLLARRGLEADVTRAVLPRLAGRPLAGGRGWDALDIMGAPDTILPLLGGHRFRRRVIAETGSVRVDLAAVRASGRPYVATLGSNTRSQVRRACRLYDERGGLRLDAAQDVDEALEPVSTSTPG